MSRLSRKKFHLRLCLKFDQAIFDCGTCSKTWIFLDTWTSEIYRPSLSAITDISSVMLEKPCLLPCNSMTYCDTSKRWFHVFLVKLAQKIWCFSFLSPVPYLYRSFSKSTIMNKYPFLQVRESMKNHQRAIKESLTKNCLKKFNRNCGIENGTNW